MLTEKNYKTILNYKEDPHDERDFIFSNSLHAPIDRILSVAPSVVDHEFNMSQVKNQGTLGSCVGFAVVAMKEWQETREHLREVEDGKIDHRKGEEYDLSESWLYWKCKEIDAWPKEEGTSIRYAMRVLNKIGVPCESAWPYNDMVKGSPESWASLVSQWSLIDSYWRINGLNELKAALLNGPVVLGIPCFVEIFYADITGYVSYPRNSSEIYGGHAITAVGYDDKLYGGIIKFKNSWGKYWGKNGYGYLPYEYINDFLWDAWACKDLSVTKEMLTKRTL